MEKTYRHLLMVMLATVMSLGLAACGDDNDNNDDNTPTATGVVGTWKYTKAGWDGYQIMTLTADGRYSLVEIDNEAENWDENGTYNVKGDVLTINISPDYGGDTEVYAILTLTSTSMILRYEGKYFGQYDDYTDEDYAVWDRVSE